MGKHDSERCRNRVGSRRRNEMRVSLSQIADDSLIVMRKSIVQRLRFRVSERIFQIDWIDTKVKTCIEDGKHVRSHDRRLEYSSEDFLIGVFTARPPRTSIIRKEAVW